MENGRLTLDDAVDFLGKEATMMDNLLPLIVDMVMPDSRQTPSWTASFPRPGLAYQGPTNLVYAWLARKEAAGVSMWTGIYAEQRGRSTELKSAWHRVETGVATRSGDVTTRHAALYIENAAMRRDGPSSMYGESIVTAGIWTQSGDVPLAEVRFKEKRQGDELFDHADRHSGETQIGVYNGSQFVPLIGATTVQTVGEGTDVTNDGKRVRSRPTERETKLGVYGSQGFVPVVGYRYSGERAPQDLWLADHMFSGGFGEQVSGDWKGTVGIYPGGTWTPIAGVTYDDDFASHRFRYRGMITTGPFVGGGYRPAVGTTYDGEMPLITASHALEDDEMRTYPRWESSTGIFPLDEYVPVAGLRFLPGAPNAKRKHRWHIQAGTYLASYEAFVPLAYASYDGDRAAGAWAAAVQAERLYGFPWNEGSWDSQIGIVAGDPVPLISASYRTSAPDGRARNGQTSSVVLGVFPPGARDPLPLIAVTIGGNDGLREKGARFEAEVGSMQPSYIALACATITADPYMVTPHLCS
jgi:hypothetical protein